VAQEENANEVRKWQNLFLTSLQQYFFSPPDQA
jgi:hypothetical protein